MDRATGIEKPRQSFAGLWNISFGFFGIQIGFALQNANMSRIFQSLGSSLDDLPALWVAAPLTGLLVQPIIGHMSDRTWLGRLGRRRPYFLAGAILAALVAVPDAARAGAAVRGAAAVDARRQPQHLDGAVPRLRRRHAAQGPAHRRLCGADRLHRRGRGARLDCPAGCSKCGACRTWRPAAASPTRCATPSGSAARRCSWRCCGRSSRPGNIRPRKWQRSARRADHPDGDATLRALAARSFGIEPGLDCRRALRRRCRRRAIGARKGDVPARRAADRLRPRQHHRASRSPARGSTTNMLAHIVGDFSGMPPIMKRLALVQFFSWSALFIMWIYTTPVVAQYFYRIAPIRRAPATRMPATGSACCSRSTTASRRSPR